MKHFLQKIIYRILQNPSAVFIPLLCIGVSVVFMWPMIQKPFFNVIDDGWSLYVAQHVSQARSISGWFDQLLIQEASIGRVRPLYYMYYILIWFFSQSNPLGYWVAQTALVSSLFILMYVLELPRTRVQKLVRLACIPCILFFPSFVTNYFRLGTAEPRQVLFILTCVIWLFSLEKHMRNKVFLISGVLLYATALLTKETSLSLFPAIIIQLFFISMLEKRHKNIAFKLAILFSFVSIFFFGLFIKVGSTGYGSGASFNISVIKSNLASFRIGHQDELLLLAFSLFIISVRFCRDFKNKNKRTYWIQTYNRVVIYASILFGQLVFLLIWNPQLERYFLIFDVLLILIFLHSVTNFFSVPKKISKDLLFLYGSGLFCWCIVWLIGIFKGYSPNPILKLQNSLQARREAICSYQENGQLIKYLLSKDQSLTNLYVLHNDYEVIYEINLFATKFDSKRNLRVISNNKDIVHDFSSKFPQLTFSSDILHDFMTDDNKKIMLARSEAQAESLATSLKGKKTVLSPSSFCEKQLNWVIWE